MSAHDVTARGFRVQQPSASNTTISVDVTPKVITALNTKQYQAATKLLLP
jgi:uncharacterized lipoprotein YajG